MNWLNQIVVYDIETETVEDKPNPLVDKLKFIGIRLPSGQKFMYNEKQLPLVQKILSRYKYVCGHNIKKRFVDGQQMGYDNIIMERYGLKFVTTQNKRQIFVDTQEITEKRAKTMLYIDFPKNKRSLRYLAQYFNLETQKGDIDYSILKKKIFSMKDLIEIKKYLFGDLDTTYHLMKYYYDMFYFVSLFLSPKHNNNLDWLLAPSGTTGYKWFCAVTQRPEVYARNPPKTSYQGALMWVNNAITSAKDIYVFDFASLYPNMMIGGNLFTLDSNGWSGENSLFEGYIKGYFSKKQGVMESEVDQMFKLRKTIKALMKVIKKTMSLESFLSLLDDLKEDKQKIVLEYYKKIIVQISGSIKLSEDSVLLKEVYNTLDLLQLAIKILMNSLYGASGNPVFESLYDDRTCSSITGMARACITHAKKTFEKHGYTVVYQHSVQGESKAWYKFGNCINQYTFNEIWDVFSKCCEIYVEGDSEYMYPLLVETKTMDKDLNIIWKPVKYIMRHKNTQQCYKIDINNQNSLIVTDDHSVMNIEHYTNKLIQVKPKSLKKVVLDTGFSDKHKTEKINHAFEFYGFWIGDGWFKKDNYIGLSTGLDKEEFIKKCLNHVVELKDNKLYHGHNGNIELCNTEVVKYMKSKGFKTGSKNKRIPEFVIHSKHDEKCSFLRGMFSADGTVIKGVPRYTTINKNLAYDLKFLLGSVGVGSTIIKENNTNKYLGKDNKTYSYHVRVSAQSRIWFKENIGFIFDRKTDKININPCKHKYGFKSINKKLTNYDGYVYDIEVEDTHNFFANDILVHNTDSLYIKDEFSDPMKIKNLAKAITRKQISDMNIHNENHLFDFEDHLKKIWLVQGDDGKNVRNRNVRLYDDNKIKYTGIKLTNLNTSKLTHLVFKNFISRNLINKDDLFFDLEVMLDWFKTEAKKDPELLVKRYRVKSPESYANTTSLQSQISMLYGYGEHYLVPNKFLGAGKSTKKATLKELKDEYKEDFLDVIDYSAYIKELKEFIKPEERKRISKI